MGGQAGQNLRHCQYFKYLCMAHGALVPIPKELYCWLCRTSSSIQNVWRRGILEQSGLMMLQERPQAPVCYRGSNHLVENAHSHPQSISMKSVPKSPINPSWDELGTSLILKMYHILTPRKFQEQHCKFKNIWSVVPRMWETHLWSGQLYQISCSLHGPWNFPMALEPGLNWSHSKWWD